MKLEVQLDSACAEPQLIIRARELTDELQALIQRITQSQPQTVAGFRDGAVTLLEQQEILRFYAQEKKVFAATAHGEYAVRQRLYELEQRLDDHRFARISNSEIVNLKQVRRFELALTGTICVRLSDGSVTYVSRRYVAKIRQILGV